MEISFCIFKTSQKTKPHEKRSKSEQRLEGGKEKDNFPYLIAARKPRILRLVGPTLTNVGLVGLLAALRFVAQATPATYFSLERAELHFC